MNALRAMIASVGGLGFIPKAPGTFGTLGGVAIAWGLAHTEHYLIWILVTIVVLYVIGRGVGDWAEARSGGKDPQWFVLDEVIGYLVAVTWVRGPSVLGLWIGFLLFRLFDISKPPPVKRFERIGGGDGILLDDVVAGLYAFGVLCLLRFALLGEEAWVVS